MAPTKHSKLTSRISLCRCTQRFFSASEQPGSCRNHFGSCSDMHLHLLSKAWSASDTTSADYAAAKLPLPPPTPPPQPQLDSRLIRRTSNHQTRIIAVHLQMQDCQTQFNCKSSIIHHERHRCSFNCSTASIQGATSNRLLASTWVAVLIFLDTHRKQGQ